MNNDQFKKVSERIRNYQPDMVQMQKELTRRPAISPESGGKGEYQRGKYLEPLLRQVFDEVKELHAKDDRAEGGIRPNYAAIYKGKDASKTIWMMAHMDTVPAGDLKMWNHDPFDAIEKDGKIYGRGVEDNQQGLVSSFFSIKALKEENVRPNYNIGLLLVSDEEIADEYGALHIMNNHFDIFGKDDLFVVPDGGDPKGELIEIAEKTLIWLKFTTKGKQGHGAIPQEAINAHRASAYLIVGMEKLHKIYHEKNPIFVPPVCTFEPTLKIGSSENFNTIPGEDVIGFDCRLLPTVNIDDFLKSVREICDSVENQFHVKINLEVVQNSGGGQQTPTNSPIARLLKKAAKDINGQQAKFYGLGAMTVAHLFRQKGFPTVVYSRLLETCHKPNEHCVIDYMINDAIVWAYMFLNA